MTFDEAIEELRDMGIPFQIPDEAEDSALNLSDVITIIDELREYYDGVIVMLIPARTDPSYWHDYIFDKAEIRFMRGRVKFEVGGESKDAAPFPSAIIIFKGDLNAENSD
jgi:hypothetical protein